MQPTRSWVDFAHRLTLGFGLRTWVREPIGAALRSNSRVDPDSIDFPLVWGIKRYFRRDFHDLGDLILYPGRPALEPSLLFLFERNFEDAVEFAERRTAAAVARPATYLLLTAGMALTLSLLHMLIFLFHRQAKENLYYAIFAGLIGTIVLIWHLKDSLLPWVFLHDQVSVRFLLLPGLLAGLRFLYSAFYDRVPRQFLFLAVGLIIAFLLNLADWLDWLVVPGLYLDFLMGIILATLLEALRVIVVAIFRNKGGAYVVGIGLIAFVILFGIAIRGLSLSEPWNQPVLYVGVAAVVFFMSVHLAKVVAQTNKNLAKRVIEVEELSARNLEQERALRSEMEEELKTAHAMQMALMPAESPQKAGLDLAGRCIPATHVGGDFFQYFDRIDNRLSISLADVTGHAMEAAVPVMMFSGILETEMQYDHTIEDLFGNLNKTLHNKLDRRTFICFTMGEFNLVSRTLRLSNCGCPYPFHYQAATQEVVELQMYAYPLGIRADATYEAIEVQLEPGDRVVFCSDGIVEAANPQREMFTFEQTAEVIRQGCEQGLAAEALLEHLFGRVKAFTGTAEQGDDMTVVVVQVTEPEAVS